MSHTTASLEVFREEIRAFLAAELPARLREKTRQFLPLERQDYVSLHRLLDTRGWAAPGWPREYGGPGWSAEQRLVFEEELGAAGAPRLYPHVNMIGPVLQKFGTPDQKARFLPPMPRLDEIWCQGYSEPGAGSDLASLSTRCERRDEHYVVTGQKIWTSYAHWADWMFCLVRTRAGGKPQEGISFLLIDMRSPGVRVRRIPTINGASDLNEVFLDEVRVPLDGLVHKENEGWTVAKYLLGFERTGGSSIATCRLLLERLLSITASGPAGGTQLMENDVLRARIARAAVRLRVQEQALACVLAGDVAPELHGIEISALKLHGSELVQELSTLLMHCAGPAGMLCLPDAGEHGDGAGDAGLELESPELRALGANYLDWRKTTIYGGTTEVQKNLIARALLG
ncbi:MAG: acyl-CoA dehydrogenase family protein [Ottowia sp.]|uniref:acyl-CoA dehydrogenase family protein n=1 Tax=Ottowia sp. TaxID=1898956 RepID=UPI003C712F51